MKTHFLKLAVAALCMSAAQAPSADAPSGEEIAMAKCSRDDASSGCPSNDTSSKSEGDQSNAASKVAAPARKSAAQKVVDTEMEAHKAQ